MAPRGLILMVLALGAAGCGGVEDLPGAKTLSCVFTAEGWCGQATGIYTGSLESQVSSQCTSGEGTFSTHGCSTAQTIPGYCAYDGAVVGLPAGLYQGRNYYGSALWTTDTAQLACTEFGGSWHN